MMSINRVQAGADPLMQNPRPVINQARCDGCGFCITACVFGVLSLKMERAVVINLGSCEREGACAEVCPTYAISMEL